MVRILTESSVAAGVRRIEAITGKAVEELMDKQQDMLIGLKSLFNNAPDLMGTIRKAISDNAELRKQVEDVMRERAANLKKEMISKQKQINGITVLSTITPLSAEYVKDKLIEEHRENNYGGLEGIRTLGRSIKSRTLYLAELQALIFRGYVQPI